jgi:hypothetical protein
MSDDDFGFAPPVFKPDDALVQIKRALRDLKLNERGHAFDLRGKRVLELSIDGAQIHARIARKLAVTPEFDKLVVAQVSDQRKLIDEIKKRLARWDKEE